MTLDAVTLQNFRCFRERQRACLAPLTLLVGDNSTGKTSFLALIRALSDVAFGDRMPDFKEEPYDLGSFEEIAHHRGGRVGHADTFEAAFDSGTYHFEVAFGKQGSAPVPVRKLLKGGDLWIEQRWEENRTSILRAGTARGSWEIPRAPDRKYSGTEGLATLLFRFSLSQRAFQSSIELPSSSNKSSSFTPEDEDQLTQLALALVLPDYPESRPFANAPVRSKPRRTYDPARPTADAQGNYIPMYLADIFFRNPREWERLKAALERFGKLAGLFDEVSIKQLGRRESEPFQVQVRKYSGKLKGPQRNLIDVGYGVSQVLPVVIELLREETRCPLLLQQPEVHLHPSAQAALGSLFCQVAAPDRQLVVETHSDHLLDRVRMDMRDKTSTLRPEQVSILFFERDKMEVRIHSLRIDSEGNILNAPDSYRQFFMEETKRSLGL